jgi:hypothetical protein
VRNAAVSRHEICRAGEWPIRIYAGALPRETWSGLGAKDGDTLVNIVQVVDGACLDAFVRNWREGEDLLVDYDHSADEGKGTAAAGWMSAPRVEGEALTANIAWTDPADVTTRRYRFFSPTFDGGAALQHLGGNRFRPTKILRGAVTNRPNIRSISPLANDEGDPTEKPTHIMDDLKQIAAALGLAEDAALADILAEIEKRAKATAEAETEIVANRRAEAAALANAHGITDSGKLVEFEKLYLANRATAKTLLGFLPTAAAAGAGKTALTNAHPAKTPATGGGEREASGQFLEKAKAQAAAEKIPLANAIAALAEAEPALYAAYRDGLGGGGAA